MSCAKTFVRATLHTRDGRQFTGTNNCRKPQWSCPREPGEGYDKCKSVCDQPAHAEVAAIRNARAQGIADDMLRGSLMVVDHHRVCPACQAVLTMHGINHITTRDKKL